MFREDALSRNYLPSLYAFTYMSDVAKTAQKARRSRVRFEQPIRKSMCIADMTVKDRNNPLHESTNMLQISACW